MSYKPTYFKLSEYECGCGCGHVPGDEILEVADILRQDWEGPLLITSGFRCLDWTKWLQAQGVPAATRSKHTQGVALDLRPTDLSRITEFHNFVLFMLEDLDIWAEDFRHTPTWAHVQAEPFGSYRPGGPRTFIP